MQEVDSKEYSWRRITVDQLLSNRACELYYVAVEPSADAFDVAIYDGENTTGDEIHTIIGEETNQAVFHPPVPVFCRRGLYIDIGSNVTAVFVQWRELHQ